MAAQRRSRRSSSTSGASPASGNIYADEALHRAGVHPLRPAGTLTLAQWRAIKEAIEVALAAGIDAKGASIDDFRHVDGARGSFQDRFLVHTRAGEPCPTCGNPIRKIVVGGRGTYVCETCQPRPRVRRAAQLELLAGGMLCRQLSGAGRVRASAAQA